MIRRHPSTSSRRVGVALGIVAATTLLLTACGGGSGTATEGAAEATGAGAEEGAAEAGASAGDVLAVTGTDDLTWDDESLTAEAGTIAFALTCEAGVNHNLVIDETDDDVVACAPGGSATGSVELAAGNYTYICDVPGHESTMVGELTVS